MYMAEGLDTGDWLLQEETPIGENETAGELHARLKIIGADALVKAVEQLKNGIAKRTKQDDSKASYAPLIKNDFCKIDWNLPAEKVRNFIRGLTGMSGAFTTMHGKRLKVLASQKSEHLPHFNDNSDGVSKTNSETNSENQSESKYSAGETVSEHLDVKCGDGHALKLTLIQLDGGKKVDVKSFLLGRKVDKGTKLGD